MKIPISIRKATVLEKKTLIARGLKLTEEAGELAAEILKYEGEKGSKKNRSEILDDLHLEAVDVMLMAMDILVKTGASDKKVTRIMDSQIKKWIDSKK